MHVTVTNGDNEVVFTFTKDVVQIGRSPDGDIVLRADLVSRRHAKLTANRLTREVLVEDLAATGGVEVAGVRVGAKGQIVGPDDVIRIGDFQVRARTDLLVVDPAADRVELTFLETLLASPRDDMTRAVYADWLEEQGRRAQARFLRAQIAIRSFDAPADPGFVKASRELRRLTAKVSAAWRARVAMTFIEPSTCSRSKRAAMIRESAKKRRWPEEGIGFDLECPKRWDEMKPTAFDGARHCDVCDEVVTYCSSIAEARMLAARGACIAVDIGVVREPGDLIDPNSLVRGRPAPPIIAPGSRPEPDRA